MKVMTMSEEDKTQKKDQQKNDGTTMTEEELNEIEQDISKAREKLVSKETQSEIEKAKEQAKQEAQKEMENKQELERLSKEKEELQEKLKQKEQASSEELEKLKKKIDDLTESKATISEQNPFKEGGRNPDNMSDEEIKEIEHRSGIAFFGEEFERPL